ncbi:MAG TPA: hypothetical protein VLK57_17735, partial [Pseudonocardia sp.]|nr:hypothetical protein [Pseudonocardia sp.]
GAQSERGIPLGVARRERDRVGAESVGEPDRQMPQPADADHAHRRAGSSTEAAQLVIGLSLTWSPASPTVTAAAGDERRDHDRRRAALAVAVRRAFRPR